MGENGSNTLREYAFFFSKTEKKNKCGRGLSQIKTNPPRSWIRNKYIQVQQTEQKRKLSSVFYFVDVRVKFGNFTS